MSSGGDRTIGGSALLGGGLGIGGSAPGAGAGVGGGSSLLGAMPGGAAIGGGGGGTIGGGTIGGGLGGGAIRAVPSVPTPGKDATEAEKIEALMPLIVQLTNPDQVCLSMHALEYFVAVVAGLLFLMVAS